MLEETLQILEIAKQAKLRGYYIDIALGKHKVPLTIKDAIKRIKNG
jgi:hypothetical protein